MRGVIAEGRGPIWFGAWNLGSADAVADRACLPVGAFRPDQTGDERIDLIASGQSFTGNLIEVGAHAVKLQFVHGFQNLVALHQAIFLMLSWRPQSAAASILRRIASRVVVLGGVAGCWRRANTV